MKKIKLTMLEKIAFFLWLYRSKNYKNVHVTDEFVFKLTKDQGWTAI